MLFKFNFSSETSSTHNAGVASFPSMYSHVYEKVTLFFEALSTLKAGIGFFPCMYLGAFVKANLSNVSSQCQTQCKIKVSPLCFLLCMVRSHLWLCSKVIVLVEGFE